jgi:hypothetical protein
LAKVHTALAQVAATVLSFDGREWFEVAGFKFNGLPLRPEMSDAGLMVPSMTEPPSRHDVTVTVAKDGDYLPNPAEFAAATEQAAWSRNASLISAHTAEEIISVVTVEVTDPPSVVATALAVVSEALRRPAASPSR